jgi:DNA-binding XRE family transcriptional regulator
VALSTIQKLEAGRQVPSVALAQRIARFLDTSIDAIWEPQASPDGERVA